MYVYFPTLQHGKIRVLSQWAKAQVPLRGEPGFYLLGGASPQKPQLSPPQKFSWKKI